MASSNKPGIQPAKGKLGVMTVGMGAVATTLIAGVEAVRKGLAKPIGSLTQMGTIRLGKRTDDQTRPSSRISSRWPASTTSSSAAGTSSAATSTRPPTRQGSRPRQLDEVGPSSSPSCPCPPCSTVLRQAPHRPERQNGQEQADLANQLREDIRNFIKNNDLDRCVVVWCASTEVYTEIGPKTIPVGEGALEGGTDGAERIPSIPPSMIYAYAALKEGVPFANGSPNLTVDAPAIMELQPSSRAWPSAARTSRPARR